MWWILEASSVKEKHLVIVTAESTHWNEVSISRLRKHFSANISDEVESFDLLSGVHCCLEQIEVCLMDIRRTSVVMNPLSLKFYTTADNFITYVSVLVADDSVF